MKIRALLLSLLAASIALAGCAGDDEGSDPPITDPNDPGTVDLGDKGAITGLLVDDRFRPIHLTDDPVTEFDATGFVLLQETGQQVKTTENGEFQFSDLAPGRYTLRVSATGHEATPTTVNVVAGEFAEQTVVARRILSEGNIILTQEYAIFSGCAVEALVLSFANPWCLGDFSNDAGRFDFNTDLRAVQNETFAMVTEAKFDRPGSHNIFVRYFEDHCTGTLGDCFMAEADIRDTDYVRFLNYPGVINEIEGQTTGRNQEFTLQYEFQTGIFPHADYTYGPIVDTCGAAGLNCRGVGTALAVKAQFLQSVFLGEPDLDVESYCVLC